MRKLILFMGPPGLMIKQIASVLLKYIDSEISVLSIEPFKHENIIYSTIDYYDELAEFSERLIHTINDSNKNETIIVCGFFVTPDERKYIDNAIKKANNKIDKKYGVWIENIGSELKKVAQENNISEELFQHLFKRRSSPIEAENYNDIYYISKHFNIGTSKRFSSMYNINDLLMILGRECNNEN